jgi:bifunctional non-homologous end joining protein LigD
MPRSATRRRLPEWVAPQLATLAAEAPAGADWIHEIKYDGFRLLAWLNGGTVRLLTRNRKDWTDRFPTVAAELADLGLQGTILDGEVVVELEDGVTSFQALQNAMRDPGGGQLRFWVFDALWVAGEELMRRPLLERKQGLKSVLGGAGTKTVRYSDHVEGNGPAFFGSACEHGLEGIICKRAAGPYRSGRGLDWLKVKCMREQEFVIGGFTEPSGSRQGLGALHVGTFDADGGLVYRGKVGTGFSASTLRDLRRRLGALAVPHSPFSKGPRGAAARVSTWVEPRLVAQIRFTELTDDGRLRHPAFLGLRDDKEASEVTLEVPSGAPAPPAPAKMPPRPGGRQSFGTPTPLHGISLSNPDKVLYPEQGVTKVELARYYQAVAEWMLPHISARPLTLVRCPSGHHANYFYQKHFDHHSVPAPLRLVEIEERDGPALYGVLNSVPGLISLVQLGALELHTWNSRADRLERPDRFVIDLDPDPGVVWDAVVDAALQVRELMAELGLESFLKTTGGKGLHVVVPLVRRAEWDEVRDFSRAAASLLARAAPDRYTLEMSKRKRKGRILLDWQRNTRGATAVEAYSTRARPGAPVAAPIHWDELAEGVRANTFTVRNMAARMLALREDPWKEMGAVRQSLTAPMKRQLGL